MDQRFEDLISYLRGRKPLNRAETPAMYADYLESDVRPVLERAVVFEVSPMTPEMLERASTVVKRGPGRPRKEPATV